MTRLIPTLVGKTHDIGHIHLDTGGTTPNMTKTERGSHMLHTIMKIYVLKKLLRKFKEEG